LQRACTLGEVVGVRTELELRAVVLDALGKVAPESAAIEIEAGRSFRDQVEIDSLDFLNFLLDIEARLGVDIPESDYPKLSSLAGCLAYLGPLTSSASER